jgi:hypothetical protein
MRCHPFALIKLVALIVAAAVPSALAPGVRPAPMSVVDPAALAGEPASDIQRPAVCFAPDSTQEQMDRFAGGGGARGSQVWSGRDFHGGEFQFYDFYRWQVTATNPCCLQQGDPTTLTWSVIPDGTSVTSGIGEGAAVSDLQARLNLIFGNPSVWLPILAQVFDRWGELTGNTYVYQPTDDGAAFPTSPGVLGVRGDVRIAGHRIDGNSGVLAYNYYPGTGDMVLDTADNFFDLTTNNALRLRNVVAHEHGHGLGLSHVCPVDRTKLMEPFASTSFDGPQHDDVRAGQRGYGDPLEPNDDLAHASNLGTIGNTTVTVAGLSIDDVADSDVLRFTVGNNRKVSLSVTPVGRVYPDGPQNSNGTCTAGTSVDSAVASDLSLQILGRNGSTVLASADLAPAGGAESVSDVVLPAGGGTFYVRVSGKATAVQLYDLRLTVARHPDQIFSDDFESGTLSAWSAVVNDSGHLAAGPAGALAGSAGLEAVIVDRKPLYVTDDSPTAEKRYHARFWMDASALVTDRSSRQTKIFSLVSSAPTPQEVVTLMLRMRSGGPQLMARVRTGSGGMRDSAWVKLGNGPQAVEIDWKKASTGVHDGLLDVWIGGVLAIDTSGLDNELRFVDGAQLGAIVVPAGTTGRLRFDSFASRRRSYIGP